MNALLGMPCAVGSRLMIACSWAEHWRHLEFLGMGVTDVTLVAMWHDKVWTSRLAMS